MSTALRRRFLLDPDVCYLNHGAFGAAPILVFEAWQRELERQPTRFLTRMLEPALADARRELAAYVGAGEDDLTFVPNATTGIKRRRPLDPARAGSPTGSGRRSWRRRWWASSSPARSRPRTRTA